MLTSLPSSRMSENKARIHARDWRFFSAQCLLFLLAVCFALQVFSPLRLNTDSISLLSMADSAAHGHGFLDAGQKTVFPPGYPALLATLVKTNLAHPAVIIGFNVLFLFAGLAAAYRVLLSESFPNKTTALLICAFSLLSFVTIKHYAFPLTDVPFFCCSMWCLALIIQARKTPFNWRFAGMLLLAWGVAALSTTVRRNGIALIPPLIFLLIERPELKAQIRKISRSTKLIAAAILVLFASGIALLIVRTSTLSDFHAIIGKSSLFSVALRVLYNRISEFGEMFFNVPAGRMPAALLRVSPFIGLISLLLAMFGWVAKAKNKLGPVEVYLFFYAGILFVWPYRDARFWLPVIPFLIAYFVVALRRLKIPPALITAYAALFAAVGLIALGYSIRITFSGGAFPDSFGDGVLRPTYCAAFHSCGQNYDPSKINAQALDLVRKFK